MDAKPLRIRFNKVDRIIKIYNGIRYLELSYSYNLYKEVYYTIYNAIFGRINYLISQKSGMTDSVSHNFVRIRVDSYNSLPIEKALTFHNIIILIKLVVNENKSYYHYNIFLEKGSYKESNTQYF